VKKPISILIILTYAVSAPAATIYVDPNGAGDYLTIQAAINAAQNADIVQVAPATYQERINFQGKNITVTSLDPDDPYVVASTIIDGDNSGSVVTFDQGETAKAILTGFTVTRGTGTYAGKDGSTDLYWGGGICCINSSPTILGNVITANHGPIKMMGDSLTAISYGGGIVSIQGSPNISRNTIRNNNAYAGAGVMVLLGNARIISNQIYENSALIGGGIILLYGGELVGNTILTNKALQVGNVFSAFDTATGPGLVSSNIICNAVKGGGLYAEPETTDVLRYNNVFNNIGGDYPYTSGLTGVGGNISTDPCLADVAAHDFHLLPDSPCIDTGDPNYNPEPNETDLDGLPRVIGGRIDMGCYEFDSCPVAVAGPNQIAHAFINGLADVNLDGSGSYDEDDDVLDYYWSWTIDSNICEANGMSPCITLPVGMHQIELVVDDGWTLSEPNYCTIDVIEPIKTWLRLQPRIFDCNSRPRQIMTLMFLPKDIEPNDVNNQPLTMYPCGIQSKYQRIFWMGYGGYARTEVSAIFDKNEICDVLGIGRHQVEVAGRLHSGRFFYGTSVIRIVEPYSHKWPFHRFYP
jgi:hypothetical protein